MDGLFSRIRRFLGSGGDVRSRLRELDDMKLELRDRKRLFGR